MQILSKKKIKVFQEQKKTNYTIVGKEMTSNSFENMITEAEKSKKISEEDMKALWKKRTIGTL